MSNLYQPNSLDLASAQPHSAGAAESWFAIQVRSRHEKKISTELQEREIQAFVPLFSSYHQWTDRRRLVHMPVFPGYVFVRIAATPATRIAVLRTPGVSCFVGVRGMGVSIPDGQIEAVQMILDRGIPFDSHPFLSIGQKVRIRGGSLDGLEGILEAKNGDQSLIVSVELIQRSLAVRVAGYRVEPA
ncbi:MAG: transcription termination/antitermination protein NusG [Candidatus Acidiferrales bacterium]